MAEHIERPDWMNQIQAVLFDMDGTLLDSEHLTARAIQMLCEEYDVQISIEDPWFHGITWVSIASTLRAQDEVFRDVPVEVLLQQHFHTALLQVRPPPIPGAPLTVFAASRVARTAVVSSSDRVSVRHVVERLGLENHLDQLVTAEDCDRSKPDPQCFQIAAQRLGVDCDRCLVFEDSVAGLTAGHAAGMRTIAIGDHHSGSPVADIAIGDFTALPVGFFDDVEVV